MKRRERRRRAPHYSKGANRAIFLGVMVLQSGFFPRNKEMKSGDRRKRGPDVLYLKKKEKVNCWVGRKRPPEIGKGQQKTGASLLEAERMARAKTSECKQTKRWRKDRS